MFQLYYGIFATQGCRLVSPGSISQMTWRSAGMRPSFFPLPYVYLLPWGEMMRHLFWVVKAPWYQLQGVVIWIVAVESFDLYDWNLKTTNTNWSKLFWSEQSESNKLFDSIEYYIIGFLFDSFVVFVKIACHAAAAGIILIRF
jgi:hypothetical protein